jgi:hypothetical protein
MFFLFVIASSSSTDTSSKVEGEFVGPIFIECVCNLSIKRKTKDSGFWENLWFACID